MTKPREGRANVTILYRDGDGTVIKVELADITKAAAQSIVSAAYDAMGTVDNTAIVPSDGDQP